MAGKKPPSITILVAYHKPAPVIRNGILVPIHAGRALHPPDNTRGNPEAEALAAMIGDDAGDSISALNPFFSEMTALYWAWKNYAVLGNPDYFGLAHYRRLLSFSVEWTGGGHLAAPDLASLPPGHYAEEAMAAIVPRHDVCVKGPVEIADYANKKGALVTVLEQYAGAHDRAHLTQAMRIAVKRRPEYTDSVREYLASRKHYLCNLFVMRRDVFFEYAAWMFPVLLEMHETLDYAGATPYQKRAVSFLSERLTGVFITQALRKGLSVKPLPGINIGC